MFAFGTKSKLQFSKWCPGEKLSIQGRPSGARSGSEGLQVCFQSGNETGSGWGRHSRARRDFPGHRRWLRRLLPNGRQFS